MKPAVLYAAKSTADKNASIPAQLAEGREVAAAEDCVVVAEFTDEGASAYSKDRGPGLAKARAEAEHLAAEHGECILIVQHSDRLARGDGVQAAHLVEYALWAIKASVKVRSIQDPQTFADLLYAVVTGQRNHEDSKRKSLATKAGRARRREKGLYGGGPTPFGYGYDKARERLTINRDEAPTVRRIFAEFNAGNSLTAIARALERDKVSTRRGRLWRSSTIGQIVSNPIYIGKMRHYDEIADGVHEALLDDALWEQAQTLLKSRRRGGSGRPPKRQHLLKGGILRCVCGATMICRSDSKDGAYVCERRQGNLGGCSSPTIPRSVIDTAVYSYFEQVGLDVDATRAQVADARDRKLEELHALGKQAHQEKQRAEERLTRVRRDYADGKITADDWSEFRAELTHEMQAASAEVDRLSGQQAEAETWADLRDLEHDTLAMLADIRGAIARNEKGESADAVRAALIRLFDHFALRGVEPGQRVHADLAWLGDLIIEPIPREGVIDSYTSLRPIFRREPLYDAGKNQGIAHASRLRRKLDPEHGRYVVNCWGIGYRLLDG
jgi:DNA invertase Pin-like site-specific DNA recombinase